MADKFHVNGDGNAGRCTATVRICPFGGEEAHYGSFDEARAAYEAAMAPAALASVESGRQQAPTTIAEGVKRAAKKLARRNEGVPEPTAPTLASMVNRLSHFKQVREIQMDGYHAETWTKNVQVKPGAKDATLLSSELADKKGFHVILMDADYPVSMEDREEGAKVIRLDVEATSAFGSRKKGIKEKALVKLGKKVQDLGLDGVVRVVPPSEDSVLSAGALGGKRHAVTLEVSCDAFLQPSSTAGHSHVYIDVPGGIPAHDYSRFRAALVDAKVFETAHGWDKMNYLRPPGVAKSRYIPD